MTSEVALSLRSRRLVTRPTMRYEDGRRDDPQSSRLQSAPRCRSAPGDTINRITRFVKVTINVTGKSAQRFDVPLLVTVVSQNDHWLISDVSGGTGP